MTGGEYATLYRKFVTQFPAYTEPYLVAAGPRGHSADKDLGWTEGFFEGLRGHRSRVDGFALHYYTDFRQTSETAPRSTRRAGTASFTRACASKGSSKITGA